MLRKNKRKPGAGTRKRAARPATASESVPASAPAAVDLDALARRASALHEQGHLEAARQVALEVVSRDRNHVPALLALASSLRDLGRFDEALRVLGHVLNVSPDNTQALSAAALTLFYKEDWPRAWRAFDVRFRLMNHPPQATVRGRDGKPVPKPLWRSGPVPRSLLVLGEQGLGDTIMFARYLPLLTRAGAKVVCVVQRRLFRLLQTLDADVEFRPSEESGSVDGIAAWTPLMHLPQALGLAPGELAQTVPYLRAEPERVARWRERIGGHGFRVGIVWQGIPDPRIDRGRSAPLAAFAPLAELPGVRLISLQVQHGLEQLTEVPFADRIERPGDDFDSGPDGFLDAAAVIDQLDLVITVDTATGHLAGALGRPAIILLKAIGSDWRWLFRREDTIWYPTVRVLRQRMPGDWNELLGRAADEVRRRAETKAAGRLPLAPVSVGELIDKLTILDIKRARIADPDKRSHVERERSALLAARAKLGLDGALDPLEAELKQVNETLWEIEDALRECEAKADFGARFVELARAVYRHNDRRAALKAEINRRSNSALREEKSYKPY